MTSYRLQHWTDYSDEVDESLSEQMISTGTGFSSSMRSSEFREWLRLFCLWCGLCSMVSPSTKASQTGKDGRSKLHAWSVVGRHRISSYFSQSWNPKLSQAIHCSLAMIMVEWL